MSIVSYINGTGKVMEGTVKGGVGTGDVAQIYGSDVILDQQVETIELGGNISDFTFKQAGNRLEIYKGSTLVAKTGLQSDADGTQLVFSDGAVDAKYDSSNLEMSLGGTVVGTGAAHAVTPATVDTAKTSTVSAGSTGSSTGGAGQTFTLTPKADISGVIKGSAGTTSVDGDDVFNGTQATYTTGDVINGGNGIDTLNLELTANNTQTPSTVVNVEKINVTAKAFADLKFDADSVVGVSSTITLANKQVGGADGFEVVNLGSGAKLVAGEGVTNTLKIQGSKAEISADALTNLNLQGTTATDDEMSVMLGSGQVALDTNANVDGNGAQQVENLVLAGKEGAVTFNLNASDAVEKVTLKGDKSITFAANAADISAKKIVDQTGSEASTTLKVNTATGVVHNLSKIDVDTVKLSDGSNGGYTFTVKNEQSVVLSADMTANGNLTINSTELDSKGTDETLNLRLAKSQTTNDTILTDFETINLKADDGSVVKKNITVEDFTAASSTVNVSGKDNLEFTGSSAAAKKIVATEFEGNLKATVSGNLKDITGGKGNDTITIVGSQDFTLDGGDGDKDVLTMTGTTDTSSNKVSFKNFEIVQMDSNDDGSPENFTVKSSVVAGQSFVLKGGSSNADTMVVKADEIKVDLSKVIVDTTSANVEIDLTSVNALAVELKGSTGADTISNTGAGAITAFGNNGDDKLVGGSGADHLNGGKGDDALTSGGGKDVLTGGEGKDTFDLSSADAVVIITDMEAGASKDLIKIDADGYGISSLKDGSGTAITAAKAHASAFVAIKAGGTTVAANNQVFVLEDKIFENADKVLSAIESGGDHQITLAKADTANDDHLVLWTDGKDGHLGAVDNSAGATTLGASSTYTELVTLTGIDTLAELGEFVGGATGNLEFV